MELVKPVEPVLWACIVELVMGGTGYGTVEALLKIFSQIRGHYSANADLLAASTSGSSPTPGGVN